MKRTAEQRQERKAADAERASEYKEYHASHPDETRTCCKCLKPKSLKEFLPTFSMRNKCRDCHRSAVNGWRSTSVPATEAIKGRSYAKSSDLIRSLKNKPCSKCGEKLPPYVLDYHHVGDKSDSVSSLYEKSPERIRAEIEKCELMCANCHRDESQEHSHDNHIMKNRVVSPPIVDVEVTAGCPTKECGRCDAVKHEENFSMLKSGKRHTYCKRCLREYNSRFSPGRKRATSEFLKSVKDNQPCKDCGRRFRYWVLDFDHIGKKTKNVSKMRGSSLEALKREIGLCELVCANCHRKRTHESRASIPRPRSAPSGEVKEFDLSLIRVSRCTDSRVSRKILEKHHYARYGREASITYLAYLQDVPIAVAKISPVVRVEVATSIGMDPAAVLELDRLCIVPDYQVKNLASKFLSMVVRSLKKDRPSVSVLVSFADPEHGHSGTVYRASNWRHIGMAAPTYEYVSAEGFVTNKKTLYNSAVRLGMKEREYAERIGLIKRHLPAKHKFVTVIG